MQHLQQALTQCKYLRMALNRLQNATQQIVTAFNPSNNTKPAKQYKRHIVIPYPKGMCENIKNICNNMTYRHTLEVAKN